MEFRIVIWNLRGLSNDSDSDRLLRAKKAFRIMADENDTAAFALVELGPEPYSVLEQLANDLGDEWMYYSGKVGKRNCEIGLLLNTKLLSATTVKLSTDAHYGNGKDIKIGREPVALFLVEHNNVSSFLLAIVHFKAEGGGSEAYTRKSLARWLKDELEEFYKETSLPIVILGDFNGEPWEEMFGRGGFHAYRRVDEMFRNQESLKLYNPMWRLLPGPYTLSERRLNIDNRKSLPYGTFMGDIFHSLIDGILVSGEWLKSNEYILHDDRLEILTNDLWHHIGAKGAHNARPKNVTK